MTFEEYFEDWAEVVDKRETLKLMKWLYRVGNVFCPSFPLTFRAFSLCPYNSCKAVFLGQDPYPQVGVATGVAFANWQETKAVSPSLKILMNAVNASDNFDISLTNWAEQGILLLNSALTCIPNQVGSHVEIWKPFITKLIQNISKKRPDITFVMFGNQAQYFSQYIKGNQVLMEKHPAYYARTGLPMPNEVFIKLNNILEEQGKPKIIYT